MKLVKFTLLVIFIIGLQGCCMLGQPCELELLFGTEKAPAQSQQAKEEPRKSSKKTPKR